MEDKKDITEQITSDRSQNKNMLLSSKQLPIYQNTVQKEITVTPPLVPPSPPPIKPNPVQQYRSIPPSKNIIINGRMAQKLQHERLQRKKQHDRQQRCFILQCLCTICLAL